MSCMYRYAMWHIGWTSSPHTDMWLGDISPRSGRVGNQRRRPEHGVVNRGHFLGDDPHSWYIVMCVLRAWMSELLFQARTLQVV